MDRGIDGRTEAAAEEEKRAIQEKSCVKIQTDALPELGSVNNEQPGTLLAFSTLNKVYQGSVSQ